MYNFEIEKRKSELFERVRFFFKKNNFIEVSTPSLSPTTIPEHTIALFSTKHKGEFTNERMLYLLPSPELYMKKMLSKFNKSIFQISKAYRNAEQTSPIHKNEFTMLEYYKVDADYNNTIGLTINLIKDVFFDAKDNALLNNPIITTINDLLVRFASITLEELHLENMRTYIEHKFNLVLPKNESFDDTFNRVFLNIIEPKLKDYNQPVFIKDYPIEIECLAKEKNTLERERFEMYFKGIEIANGYSEMTDNAKIKELFKSESGKITQHQDIDVELMKIKMPKSSGVAIGIDRLIMVSEQISNINDLNFY